MLMLPKFTKGIKQAMTKLEKACKVIVGITLVVGLTSVSLPNEAQAGSIVSAQTQSAMLLVPASGPGMGLSDHYSHSSHESHSSHYSSRY